MPLNAVKKLKNLVKVRKVVEAGSTLRVHHVQERGKPRVTTDFKGNSVHWCSRVQVVDEKHDAVVRVGLSTSLSQTVAPLRTESRDRCPSVFLFRSTSRMCFCWFLVKTLSLFFLRREPSLARLITHVSHNTSAPGDSGSPALGLYVLAVLMVAGVSCFLTFQSSTFQSRSITGSEVCIRYPQVKKKTHLSVHTPPGNLNINPLKFGNPKRKGIIFQPSYFRDELLDFGGWIHGFAPSEASTPKT